MEPLALVTKLAARWHYLHCFQIWPPDGTAFFSCNFGHLMAPLALNPLEFVANLVTRWQHLHWFQIWPPDGPICTSYKFYHQIAQLALVATCISCKIGHQLVPLTLVTNFATRWHNLHWSKIWPPGWVAFIATMPWIVLLALSVSIGLVSPSARITSVEFAKGNHNRTHRSDPRDTWVR